MEIKPHSPAFPVVNESDKEYNYIHKGMSIRMEVASRILAGFAANPDRTYSDPGNESREALILADALIVAYNESEP